MIDKLKLQTYTKYAFFVICFLCYFTHFGYYTEALTELALNTINYLPYIGIITIILTSNFKINTSPMFLSLGFLLYIIAASLGMPENELLILLILCILFSNEDPKYFIKFIFVFYTVFLLSSITLSILRIFPFGVIERYIPDSDLRPLRYCFNFYHPNQCGLFFLSLYCIYTYTLKRVSKTNYIFLLLCGLFFFSLVYFYIDSRTSALLILLVLILNTSRYIFTSRINIPTKIKYFFSLVIPYIPLILFIFTILISYYYDKNNILISKLDHLLSGRLRAQNRAITICGIPLFGLHLKYNSPENFLYLDNNYIQYIYSFGLFFTSILILSFCKTLKLNFVKSKNKILLTILIITWSFLALSEAFAIHFFFNPIIILLLNNFSRTED